MGWVRCVGRKGVSGDGRRMRLEGERDRRRMTSGYEARGRGGEGGVKKGTRGEAS